MTAEVMTPVTLAPSASASTNEDGLSCETIFCATLAVVGTQLTAAMPMTGLKLPRLKKYTA